MILLFSGGGKRPQMQNEVGKGFLWQSCDTLQVPKGHLSYLREIIIYCVPTLVFIYLLWNKNIQILIF